VRRRRLPDQTHPAQRTAGAHARSPHQRAPHQQRPPGPGLHRPIPVYRRPRRQDAVGHAADLRPAEQRRCHREQVSATGGERTATVAFTPPHRRPDAETRTAAKAPGSAVYRTAPGQHLPAQIAGRQSPGGRGIAAGKTVADQARVGGALLDRQRQDEPGNRRNPRGQPAHREQAPGGHLLQAGRGEPHGGGGYRHTRIECGFLSGAKANG